MKTVALGTLAKGDIFYDSGLEYRVVTNLGEAGVSVQPMATVRITIGEVSFTRLASRSTQVWAASSSVQVDR